MAKKVVATKGAVQDFLLHGHFLLCGKGWLGWTIWLKETCHGGIPKRHLQLTQGSMSCSHTLTWEAPMLFGKKQHPYLEASLNHKALESLGFWFSRTKGAESQSMSFLQRKSLLLYKLVARSPYTHSQHFTTRFHLKSIQTVCSTVPTSTMYG